MKTIKVPAACLLVFASLLRATGFAAGEFSLEEPPEQDTRTTIPRMTIRRYATVEFHDPRGEMWPAYILAFAPKDGWFEYGDARHRGRFELEAGGNMAQAYGAQDRRIIGELVRRVEVENRDGTRSMRRLGPEVKLSVLEFAPVKARTNIVVRQTKRGEEREAIVDRHSPVKAAISVGDKTLTAWGRLTVNLQTATDSVTRATRAVGAAMCLVFELRGDAIGLKKQADRAVTLRVYVNGAAQHTGSEGAPNVQELIDEKQEDLSFEILPP
jgi:hypothetical protein